ncbi:MAG: hypothetical protein M3N13_04930 [Candidatus Eremiobacteraeota bacterium]|nr:hypothetical protein [Candidatus Eremiobacteraeota bacterium]
MLRVPDCGFVLSEGSRILSVRDDTNVLIALALYRVLESVDAMFDSLDCRILAPKKFVDFCSGRACEVYT